MRRALRLAVSTALITMAGSSIQADRQMPATMDNPITTGLSSLFSGIEATVMPSAELATPELLAYRPSADVRTYGEILGHIADAQFALCEGIRGNGVDLKDTVEKTVKTKAGLTKALRDSFDACKAAFGAVSDADASSLVSFGPRQSAVATLMTFTISHSNEHYGNLVTYMRLNGIVPPSSRQGDLP